MLHKDIEIRESLIHGKGLFATKFIATGTVLWTLDPQEKRLTFIDLMQLLPNHRRLAYSHDDAFIVRSDGSEFANHSCEPNMVWEGDNQIIALRDIFTGEELTIDYATYEISPGPRPPFWGCACGAPNCRRIVTVKDCLRSSLQERYAGHFPSWVKAYIESYKK